MCEAVFPAIHDINLLTQKAKGRMMNEHDARLVQENLPNVSRDSPINDFSEQQHTCFVSLAETWRPTLKYLVKNRFTLEVRSRASSVCCRFRPLSAVQGAATFDI